MASLQASSVISSSTFLSSCCRRTIIRGTINLPRLRPSHLALPNLSTRGLVEELDELRNGYTSTTTTHIRKHSISPKRIDTNAVDPEVMAKLYAIMEAVADRVEMHNNIGEQRNNWNSLLLTSINAITLGAATMCGIAASTANFGAPNVGLKLSSTLLYLAATGMLFIINKIQPSQLVEEQRNAARLFKQLQGQIQTTIAIGTPTVTDVKDFMDRVLALDKAYPLPLLRAMLEKFSSKVEPAV